MEATGCCLGTGGMHEDSHGTSSWLRVELFPNSQQQENEDTPPVPWPCGPPPLQHGCRAKADICWLPAAGASWPRHIRSVIASYHSFKARSRCWASSGPEVRFPEFTRKPSMGLEGWFSGYWHIVLLRGPEFGSKYVYWWLTMAHKSSSRSSNTLS